MPPRVRITREMIEEAALQVARKTGAESISARSVAQALRCSTQPVMYHFATVEDLKKAAYARLDHLHTEFLLNVPSQEAPILGIGLNYIRFAIREPHWFRFLFQSGYASETNLLEMIDSPEAAPILSAMQAETGLNMEKMKEVFLTVALFTHGYASIIANNALEYDEALAAKHLERVFMGAMMAAKEEETP